MALETSSVAGVVAGRNPLEYSVSSPYTLFLFQAAFIIIMCQLVHYPVKKLQQPRVIAEVITGILLGPTVLGRIPKFTATCFPAASIPNLTLIANIGIILFLFMIGLEVDVGFIKKHLKVAVTVGLINMAIPFGLGCAISVGIYNEYIKNDSELTHISFTTFMVFIAVAICITAFPVLARILTELNLIGDKVGTIVLAAGITNDLVGWMLLALTVTLANASKPVNTVYILLLTVAWFLVICFPIRLALRWYLRRFTSDLTKGEPSQLSMVIILLLVFVSSFYTDIIGVHPIFGAFMVGIIVPRDNGYVIRITEKLEDLINLVFIPIYFALAGLNVNLGLLSHGIDWAYTIGVICLAMVGKIIGGFLGSKIYGLLWRQSLTVGVLMSCKGIVEIVVLTVGLNAHIISAKVYSMFIVMALVTTFLTTPLTLWSYPVSYREKADKYLKGEINWDGTPITAEVTQESTVIEDKTMTLSLKNIEQMRIPRVVLLFKNFESLTPLMTFGYNLVKPGGSKSYKMSVKGLHIRELGSRTSHLLEASTQGDDREATINEKEVSNSASILSIANVFFQLMGIHYTSVGLIALFKNFIFNINDEIESKKELVLASTRIDNILTRYGNGPEDVAGEESEFALYRTIFHACKSNFGLLITPTAQLSAVSYVSEDSERSDVSEDQNSLLGMKSVNIVLNHESYLSSSDILAIHLASKLSHNLTKIRIFIRSSGAAQLQDFNAALETLLGNQSGIELSIQHIKEGSRLTDEIQRQLPNLRGETFIIGNNLAQNGNQLFTSEVHELADLCSVEDFNLVVVKSPFV